MSSEKPFKPQHPFRSYEFWKTRTPKRYKCYPGTLNKLYTTPEKVERCQYCGEGVIFVYRAKKRAGVPQRPIPIEPKSWEGSPYFWPRIHRFHGNRCERWRGRKGMPKVVVDQELVVEETT